MVNSMSLHESSPSDPILEQLKVSHSRMIFLWVDEKLDLFLRNKSNKHSNVLMNIEWGSLCLIFSKVLTTFHHNKYEENRVFI